MKMPFKKLAEILEKYPDFRTIFLDDWCGKRFIYDLDCGGDCTRCPLYQVVKNEKETDGFTAGLYLASAEEKYFFGPQQYLNCKSFVEYQDCYVNFLVKKCSTREEIWAELDLVKNMRVLYTREGSPRERERVFREEVLKKTLASCSPSQRKFIMEYLVVNPDFY